MIDLHSILREGRGGGDYIPSTVASKILSLGFSSLFPSCSKVGERYPLDKSLSGEKVLSKLIELSGG